MIHDGETTPEAQKFSSRNVFGETHFAGISAFSAGFFLGLLVGEGHFGGDGKQPQVTLRMHVRHEPLLRWVLENIPGGKLYGPYNHGGRHYYQWMARGEVLKNILIPLLDSLPFAQLDPHSYERYRQMKERYKIETRG
jgi:hypothetical protein